ncbi:MAG: TetR family transcriptional regulator [Nocardioidaceae bacterium]|nr:TetR family transcriptional regulator [Nocardioidaceae bacterium]
MTAQPRGRRPGSPDTRAAILEAARALFAERGFAGASVRAIASAAGVDPALVHHYFGSKDDLFIAALQIPVDPRELLAGVVARGAEGAAERLLHTFLSVWDDPELRLPLLGVARSVMDPSGARLLRDGFLPVVLLPVGAGLGIERPEVRMPLVASQVIGLILLRYVVAVEPLASMTAEDVVAIYAPTIQRYLTGPLPS